ncbi:MAG: F0F1 ATP synthase subunit alpha [Actinomycetota bacterium]|nr:F0F1 ATP synthase subunit alpha [Actinomycetota bacterium]
MADLSITTSEISDALSSMFQTYKPGMDKQEVGRVVDAGDGIARISGLPHTLANEMLEFPGGLIGIALNLEEDEIGAVLLGDADAVEEGMPVTQTGDVLSINVGDAYLGRVVDALGRPLDGLGPLDESKIDGRRELELQAPSVINRQPVSEPMQTGIKAIDAMTPIGRGQRELLIGDRQTGKTAVAIDTIINQKEHWGTPKGVKCIYVAIGQKNSTVAEVVKELKESGAMEYTCVVNAPAATPSPFKFIAPYAGCAIGQHWMYKGEHVLIVYDDLSKQADAYRQISLLLRRPPGREAFPGDVFYLHSRLLERGAKLSAELGGGSMTALPVIETKEGDIGAYIPTNVISITDGQIFFESDLFNQGVRPAVNVGTSVSRVGGAAQIKGMKQVAGALKIQLAQYRELAAFAGFGSDLDKASQDQLARGERLTELLKQPQFSPVPVERQVISIFAGMEGYLDDVPVVDILRFNSELLDHIATRSSQIIDHLKSNGDLPAEVEKELRLGIENFKATFVPTDTSGLSESEKKDAEAAIKGGPDAATQELLKQAGA